MLHLRQLLNLTSPSSSHVLPPSLGSLSHNFGSVSGLLVVGAAWVAARRHEVARALPLLCPAHHSIPCLPAARMCCLQPHTHNYVSGQYKLSRWSGVRNIAGTEGRRLSFQTTAAWHACVYIPAHPPTTFRVSPCCSATWWATPTQWITVSVEGTGQLDWCAPLRLPGHTSTRVHSFTQHPIGCCFLQAWQPKPPAPRQTSASCRRAVLPHHTSTEASSVAGLIVPGSGWCCLPGRPPWGMYMCRVRMQCHLPIPDQLAAGPPAVCRVGNNYELLVRAGLCVLPSPASPAAGCVCTRA